jgi:transposase
MIEDNSPLDGSFSDEHQTAVYQDDLIGKGTIPELLIQAKRSIESSDASLHNAAECIAAAEAQGASQREIADAVGRSASWVNRLLKWRRGGYRDETPFGPQSKARRQQASGVEATQQKKHGLPSGSRDLLVKTLGMLGSDHSGERDNAARTAEGVRKEFGLTWDQLIIPAKAAKT